MAKLKITKEQLERVIFEGKPISLVLTEASNEVVVGLASLAGLKLSGRNEIVAKNALKDENTLKAIKASLEDESQLAKIIKDMEEKGMKDVESFLLKNVDSIISKFNETSRINKLDFITKSNIVDLKN